MNLILYFSEYTTGNNFETSTGAMVVSAPRAFVRLTAAAFLRNILAQRPPPLIGALHKSVFELLALLCEATEPPEDDKSSTLKIDANNKNPTPRMKEGNGKEGQQK